MKNVVFNGKKCFSDGEGCAFDGKVMFFFPLFGNCNRVQKYVRHTSLYSIGGSNTVLSFSKKVLIRFCTFMVAS